MSKAWIEDQHQELIDLRTVLQRLLTDWFPVTLVTVLVVISSMYFLVLARGWSNTTQLGEVADFVLKATGLLAGGLWALNRYFAHRTDEPQLRVDSDVSLVHATNEYALLVFRLDVVNTGKTLIRDYNQFLTIESVAPTSTGVVYRQIYRWPAEGSHGGGPIEPGSWSAVNDAISVPGDLSAVRIALDIALAREAQWTWHKTFPVAPKGGLDE